MQHERKPLARTGSYIWQCGGTHAEHGNATPCYTRNSESAPSTRHEVMVNVEPDLEAERDVLEGKKRPANGPHPCKTLQAIKDPRTVITLFLQRTQAQQQ